MACTLVQTPYDKGSQLKLVSLTLQTKLASQSDRGVGPLSCWAGIAFMAGEELRIATGFSQMKVELDGVSPYKNQWVKYHGELAGLALALDSLDRSGFTGGRLPILGAYVEMSPCGRCGPALDNLLPDGTTVYYSFDYATQKSAWEAAAKQLCGN